MPVVIERFEMVPESVAAPTSSPPSRSEGSAGPHGRADEMRALLAREAERSLRGRSC